MPIALRPEDHEFDMVEQYYKQTPLEPGLATAFTVKGIVSYPFHLPGVMDSMAALKQKEYLVISHGTDDGLLMPVTRDSDVDALNDQIKRLLIAVAADDLATDAKRTVTTWTELLKLIETRAAQSNVMADPKVADQDKIKAAESLYSDWVEKLLRIWKSTEPALKAALHSVRAVRKLDLSNVEIRGCSIEGKIVTLELLRKLLNAKRVSAPKVAMFYGPVSPFFPPPTNVVAFAKTPVPQNGRRIYFPKNPKFGVMVADFTPTDEPAGSIPGAFPKATPGSSTQVLEIVQNDLSGYSFAGAVNSKADISALGNELLPVKSVPKTSPRFLIAGLWGINSCRFPGNWTTFGIW